MVEVIEKIPLIGTVAGVAVLVLVLIVSLYYFFNVVVCSGVILATSLST